MPSERYIPPTAAQLLKWEQEAEAKEKFQALRSQLIVATLRKKKKEELIQLLMSLDTYDPSVRWSIEAAIDLKKPADLVVHDMREAIGIATKVDEARINTNFPYSWKAYEEVKRSFRALLILGQLELAKSIAIEFMLKASYQIACSDEGRMFEEVEACLEPVIVAAQASSPRDHREWAIDMLHADQTATICLSSLTKLATTN